ncbi:transposase [Micromonospora tulbaghiae]|uniref:transposase n=1 Tax=Micromonospora tulbaghiae TaxID=479978 RepID=UPI0036B7B4A7
MEFAQQLVERAKADGVSLVGPGGLLAGITRAVLESALGAELDAHLDEAGVDEATGRRVNIRNGHGAKTVQTEVGPVRILPLARPDHPTAPYRRDLRTLACQGT